MPGLPDQCFSPEGLVLRIFYVCQTVFLGEAAGGDSTTWCPASMIKCPIAIICWHMWAPKQVVMAVGRMAWSKSPIANAKWPVPAWMLRCQVSPLLQVPNSEPC